MNSLREIPREFTPAVTSKLLLFFEAPAVSSEDKTRLLSLCLGDILKLLSPEGSDQYSGASRAGNLQPPTAFFQGELVEYLEDTLTAGSAQGAMVPYISAILFIRDKRDTALNSSLSALGDITDSGIARSLLWVLAAYAATESPEFRIGEAERSRIREAIVGLLDSESPEIRSMGLLSIIPTLGPDRYERTDMQLQINLSVLSSLRKRLAVETDPIVRDYLESQTKYYFEEDGRLRSKDEIRRLMWPERYNTP
jgi:hypothetical protein